MSKTSKLSLSIAAALACVQTCAENIGSAQAALARESFNALRVGADTESIVQAIRDGASASNASVSVYVSQFRRLAAAPQTLRDTIWQEREAAGTWVGFMQLLRVYDVPTAGKGRPAGQGRGKGKNEGAANPAPQAGLDTLPGLFMGLQSIRAAAPKATANGEVFALLEQALALIRQEISRAEKAKAASI